jgi:hypothetical protein
MGRIGVSMGRTRIAPQGCSLSMRRGVVVAAVPVERLLNSVAADAELHRPP